MRAVLIMGAFRALMDVRDDLSEVLIDPMPVKPVHDFLNGYVPPKPTLRPKLKFRFKGRYDKDLVIYEFVEFV